MAYIKPYQRLMNLPRRRSSIDGYFVRTDGFVYVQNGDMPVLNVPPCSLSGTQADQKRRAVLFAQMVVGLAQAIEELLVAAD